MSKLGNVRPKDVLRALEKHGFFKIKTVGSHIDLRDSLGHPAIHLATSSNIF